jgi:hypothetical protein
MRLHRRNPAAGKLSVSPTDQYSALRFARITQTIRPRRSVLLVIGGLLLFIGMVPGNAIVFRFWNAGRSIGCARRTTA